ncbi:uncharacterized protein LOC141764210 isoform X2 [Sebastes fasciatus]
MGNNGHRRYPMFSLAVSIPYNSDKKMYDISKVIDSADQVKNTILRCEVYTGTRVVAATVLRWPNVLDQCPDERVQWPQVLRKCPKRVITWANVKEQCPDAVNNGTADHAEYRTLQHFNTLTRNLSKTDLLLFYVLSSPCDARCTNESNRRSILDSINQILIWSNYAVVFSNVFIPVNGKCIPEENLRGALERLGTHKGSLGSIGLRNIFRCDADDVDRRCAVQCTSCSTGNQVTRYCYTNDSSPRYSNNLPSTSFIQPQCGKSDSTQVQRQKNNINTRAGDFTNVDSNTEGVVGQGGSGRRGGEKAEVGVNTEELAGGEEEGEEEDSAG